MENERRKKLMESVKQFNKNNKSEVFTLGNEIEDTPVIPTGILAFDSAIGGGVKRGAHTIIYGQFSVGKTALVMHLIANSQKLGLNTCYVNTEKPISPDRFKFFGIDLDTLLYIEAPESAELALEALRTLCKDKVIDLFIIDSTNGLCPLSVQEKKEGEERGLDKKNVAALPMTLSNFYNVVNAQIFRAKAAVVWLGQLRTKGIGSYITMDGLTGGNSQLFYSYQIIRLRKGQKADNPVSKVVHWSCDPDMVVHKETKSEDIGHDVVAKLEKTNSSKSLREGGEIHIPYYYECGFATPNLQDEKFVIEGTDEEKVVIRKKLLEKGILKEEDIYTLNDGQPINKVEQLSEERKEDDKKLESKVPSKRGRKPKAK